MVLWQVAVDGGDHLLRLVQRLWLHAIYVEMLQNICLGRLCWDTPPPPKKKTGRLKKKIVISLQKFFLLIFVLFFVVKKERVNLCTVREQGLVNFNYIDNFYSHALNQLIFCLFLFKTFFF